MGFQLKVTSGPATGQTFQLKPGQIIGRANSDILINDPKISGRHAKIEKGPSGEWIISDLGSTNGLRIKGKKYGQIPLSNGLSVKIGNSIVEFIESEAANAVEMLDDSATLPPVPTETKEEPKIKDWGDFFAHFSERALQKVKSRPKNLKPFKPLVVLSVTRGLQSGTEWVLGYGPRNLGLSTLDLHIFDPAAPPVVCSIEPKGVSAFFQTEHPDKVKLNGRSVSSDMLKAGDEITVAETTIRVSYKE